MRELRPRRGKSRWRPLYRRADEALFAILAIGPETEIDKAGYAKAVRLAKQRAQRQLAERLGVHQSDVARMETGEHTPSLERLVRVASGLDIELMIDIRPEKKKAQLPKKRALDAGSFAVGGCEIVLATA